MKLGKEIAQIRKDNSMTQEAFGQIFHVTRQTVSNWENEKSYPDLETLVAISDRFGISLDTLLKEDEHMIQTIDKERRRGKRLLKIDHRRAQRCCYRLRQLQRLLVLSESEL